MTIAIIEQNQALDIGLLDIVLLQALAQIYGREQIESGPGSGEKISLYDHAFANTCQMINDGCMNVRVCLIGQRQTAHHIHDVLCGGCAK